MNLTLFFTKLAIMSILARKETFTKMSHRMQNNFQIAKELEIVNIQTIFVNYYFSYFGSTSKENYITYL